MADRKSALEKHLVGKYVCPSTDEVVPVWSIAPPPEVDCPFFIEHCEACGEKHTVGCDDLLEADESDWD